MTQEIFDDCVRSLGDLAGVFEYDGETGYFYLYDLGGDTNKKIIDAIHIVTGQLDFGENDVCIRWTAAEDMVGLYVQGSLCAVFDTVRKQKYGGNYRDSNSPSLPRDVIGRFGN